MNKNNQTISKQITQILFVIYYVLSFSHTVHATNSCQTLFADKLYQPIKLSELYSSDTFLMGPAFREIFKTDANNKIDYARAGAIWQETLKNFSEVDKNKIKRDLMSKKIQGSRFYNNDFIWRIDLLIFSLDPMLLSRWVLDTETSPRSYKMSWQLAVFIRSYNLDLAYKMANLAIQKYPQALKTRIATPFNSELSGFIDILPGKRSLMVMIKAFLGLPEKVVAHTQNGKINAKSLMNEIEKFQVIVADQLQAKPIINTQQQYGVIKELQKIIQDYKKTQSLNQNNLDYLVLDGSFANGLALTDQSDIDLAIYDKPLRQYVNDNLIAIQERLHKTMKSQGYANNPLRIENIAQIHPEHFSTLYSDLNFGFIGTLSFKISANKIEVVVYDYQKSTPHKVVFSTYEIIE